jgi:hypothetical protein
MLHVLHFGNSSDKLTNVLILFRYSAMPAVEQLTFTKVGSVSDVIFHRFVLF